MEKTSQNRKVRYPENILLNKDLRNGDKTTISRLTGKSRRYITYIFTGERKLTPEVREIYDVMVEQNQKLKELNKKPNV